MYELILALKVAHADYMSLIYKIVNYRWNTSEENTDSMRADLLLISQELFSVTDLIGEHIRSLTLPDSPNINNVMGLSTIEIDIEPPPTVEEKIQSLINANNALLQSLQTSKIMAQELNANDTISIIDSRIIQHQALGNRISALIGN